MPRGIPPSIARSVSGQADSMLRSGQRFRRFDQIRQRHFWSTQLFTPDTNGYIPAGDFDVFTAVPGQSAQGFPVPLTDKETNWKSSNRVPDNQNFEITEIGVTIHPISSLVDNTAQGKDQLPPGTIINSFLQNTVVAIRYLTNSVELGLVQDYSQPCGPTMGLYQPFDDSTVSETRLPRRYALNGFAAPGLRRRFRIPILLQHGETFTFRYLIPRSFFTGPTNSTAFSIVARFDFWATESFVEKS